MELDPLAHTSFSDDDITEDEIVKLRQIPAGTVQLTQPYSGSVNAGNQHGLVAGTPSEIAKKATDFGLQFVAEAKGTTAYHTSKEVQETNPLLGNAPYKLDSASFVYWSYAYAGVLVTKKETKPTPITIRNANTLHVVGEVGSGINPMNLTYGDIVFFNGDRHVGIYVGDGEFVAFNGTGYDNYEKGCERRNMTSGYWRNRFEGHVMRH